tara:strand:+ start:1166 stop:1459 length:294 start_codon:yes stop_codon:yes gene_type:complete
MSNSISKNNPNRWFLIQDSGTGESSIIVFGKAGKQGVNQLVTGQPNLVTYLTEDELEIEVNNVAGIPNYYKDAVESGNDRFMGVSGKYTPTPPPDLP